MPAAALNHGGDVVKIVLRFGEWYDEVLVDGKPLRPERSQKLVNHSPDGFAWGYHGSGPAQLALALLLAAGVPDDDAVRLHQRFKTAYVGTWPQRRRHEVDVDVTGWARKVLALEAAV